MSRIRLIGFAVALFSAGPTARAQGTSSVKPPPASKSFHTAQLLYLDITTDKTGAVAQVEFKNKVPEDIQAWIRQKIMGRHFGIPNHTYQRVVELSVPR